MKYEQFIATKRLVAPAAGIAEPPGLSPRLFEFQSDITRWALRRGRAAIWADCGLGKSWMALEWARVVHEHTGGRVLILTPLAVAPQFVTEGQKLGTVVTLCREDDDVRDGINVANYDRIHKFDVADFVGMVADESSILKDYTSATRNVLVDAFARTPYRLACTATPAPNDHMELGNHAEFLGIMSRTEMLSRFFVHDGGDTQSWRLKGHAQADFWRWVSSWACNVRRPSDLGYDDAGFVLPPLNIHEHVVNGSYGKSGGFLFGLEQANTLQEQRAARRDSLGDRVRLAAEFANGTIDQWIVWCDLNDESAALAKAIDGAVEVTGSQSTEEKEAGIARFLRGEARCLVSKPSICGWGLNMQCASKVLFVGITHSFEAWYQAIRRSYRFGQKRAVDCHVVTSNAEGAVVANLKRKQTDAETMAVEMVSYMADITRAEIRSANRDFDEYTPTQSMRLPAWLEAS